MFDPTEIIKCWKNYFNDIYTPSITSNDVDFSEVVNSTVKQACAPCRQIQMTLFICVVNWSVIQLMGMIKYMLKI